jgi:hypothetical protein
MILWLVLLPREFFGIYEDNVTVQCQPVQIHDIGRFF